MSSGLLGLSNCLLVGCFLSEERVYELVDLAVKDGLYIGGLMLRTEVLDQLVGEKDVVADLVGPSGIDGVTTDLGNLLYTLLLRNDQQFTTLAAVPCPIYLSICPVNLSLCPTAVGRPQLQRLLRKLASVQRRSRERQSPSLGEYRRGPLAALSFL